MRMRVLSLAVAIFVVPTPIFGQDTLPRLQTEESVLSASNSADSLEVARLAMRRQFADSLLGQKGPELRLYARLGTAYETSDSIVPVVGGEWPENTNTGLAILKSPSGNVIAAIEEPTSYSGDWTITYTHYFDSTGKTVVFKRYSGFFNGCSIETKDVSTPRPARETSVYYYSSGGRLLGKTYDLVTFEGEPINPSECEFMYRFDYVVHATWSDFAHAQRLPDIK